MKIDIDIDIDDIMPQILLETIGNVYTDIIQLKEREILETYQEDDLEYDLKLLHALKVVYRHFSTSDEWSKVHEYDLEVTVSNRLFPADTRHPG